MNEWVKTGNPTKLRMEITAAGQTTDIIYDGQNYYMYMPSANIAYQMSVTAAQQYTANSGDTSSLTQYNPVLVGPDTVNGMACTVYQYTVQGVSTKIWIWNQYGLPVQMVSGTTTIVYSNYSFSSIADSEFQLPAGVTVTTMPVIPTTTP
jgi:outer membrane lipoprotein-sorting protein